MRIRGAPCNSRASGALGRRARDGSAQALSDRLLQLLETRLQPRLLASDEQEICEQRDEDNAVSCKQVLKMAHRPLSHPASASARRISCSREPNRATLSLSDNNHKKSAEN